MYACHKRRFKENSSTFEIAILDQVLSACPTSRTRLGSLMAFATPVHFPKVRQNPRFFSDLIIVQSRISFYNVFLRAYVADPAKKLPLFFITFTNSAYSREHMYRGLIRLHKQEESLPSIFLNPRAMDGDSEPSTSLLTKNRK